MTRLGTPVVGTREGKAFSVILILVDKEFLEGGVEGKAPQDGPAVRVTVSDSSMNGQRGARQPPRVNHRSSQHLPFTNHHAAKFPARHVYRRKLARSLLLGLSKTSHPTPSGGQRYQSERALNLIDERGRNYNALQF
jgi:hypothetical protein